MHLSAAYRKVLLLLLVLLIGVWVGRRRLIDQQPDGQDHPRSTEMRSNVERWTRFPGRGERPPKSKDNRPDHVRNKLSKASPTAPIPARNPPNESWSASYSLQDGMTQEGPAIEVSPQSMEDDLRQSYADAGVAPEDIPDLVQNILGMIWPEDPQTPDAYPHLSTP